MAVQFEKPIALGADHGGYELKEAIKQHLEERGIAYRDFGTNSTASCDYPDYAAATCGAVTNGSSDFAILCCGTGVGMSMCANKIKGIRACCCSEPSTPAATTTPIPCAWAAALWAPALPARSLTPFWTTNLRAAATRSALTR